MSARVGDSSWAVPRVGELVGGKYRVLEVIGEGGLAVVLSALHEQLDERVALKVLQPAWRENADVVARFLREGRACTKIHSEHVVRVYDVGETNDGGPYIVMEYLDGRDLAQVVAAEGALPIAVAVDHIAQACEAIAEAHALTIIHRDLKPANLFLTVRADGSPCVKVLDFGISRLRKSRAPQADDDRERQRRSMTTTNPSLIMGSPHYMSPEQLVSTRDADERSDVWALGACLHELLSGMPPFQGDTAPELCAHVMQDDPPLLSTLRVDVPVGLESTVLVALRKDPEERFSTVAGLANAIAGYGTDVAKTSAERAARVLARAGIAAEVAGKGGSTRVSLPRIEEAIAVERVVKRRPLFRVAVAVAFAALAAGGVLVGRPPKAVPASMFAAHATPRHVPSMQASTTPEAPPVGAPGVATTAPTTESVASTPSAAPAHSSEPPNRQVYQPPHLLSGRHGAMVLPPRTNATLAAPPSTTPVANDGLFEERK